MLQFKLIISFFALALLVVGAQGMFSAANQQPKLVTYVQFTNSTPVTGDYIDIAGTSLDLAHSAPFTRSNLPATGPSDCYFVAVRGAGAPPSGAAHIFVKTSDPALVKAAAAFHTATDGKSAAVARAYIKSHGKSLVQSKSVIGMVGLGDLVVDDAVRAAIAQHVFNADPKMVLLDGTAKPSSPNSVIMLGLGFVGAILAVVLWLRKEAPAALPMPKSFGVTGPGSPAYTPVSNGPSLNPSYQPAPQPTLSDSYLSVPTRTAGAPLAGRGPKAAEDSAAG